MSLVTDTTKLLHSLYAFAVSPDDPDRGHHLVKSEELEKSLGWTTRRLNDAIDYAEKQRWVEVDESLGSHP
jgi:hypothetical protein